MTADREALLALIQGEPATDAQRAALASQPHQPAYTPPAAPPYSALAQNPPHPQYGAYPYTPPEPPKPPAEGADGTSYDSLAIRRKLKAAVKLAERQLNQIEHAGAQKLTDELARELTDHLDGVNRAWAGHVMAAKQGKAHEEAAERARRRRANHAPSAIVRAWVENETEPDLFGGSSQELYDLFVESCRRKQIGVNKIPSLHSWGRALTELGYPSLQKRQGPKVQKWRAMRPRSDG